LPERVEPITEGNLPRPYEDVRQWLDIVESMGELKWINRERDGFLSSVYK